MINNRPCKKSEPGTQEEEKTPLSVITIPKSINNQPKAIIEHIGQFIGPVEFSRLLSTCKNLEKQKNCHNWKSHLNDYFPDTILRQDQTYEQAFAEQWQLMLEAITNNPNALQDGSDFLKRDKEFMLKALRINGLTFQYASNPLKFDIEVILTALINSNNVENEDNRYNAEDLYWDIVFLDINMDDTTLSKHKPAFLQAIEQNVEVIDLFNLKNNKKFMLDAVTRNIQAIKHTNKKIQYDAEVVLTAVAAKGAGFLAQFKEYSNYELEPTTFSDHQAIFVNAIKKDPEIIKYASEKLKNENSFKLKVYNLIGVNALSYIDIPSPKDFNDNKLSSSETKKQKGLIIGKTTSSVDREQCQHNTFWKRPPKRKRKENGHCNPLKVKKNNEQRKENVKGNETGASLKMINSI